MSTWQDIRSAIIAILSEVDGIGTILTHAPDIKKWGELEPHLVTVAGNVKRLNLWVVRRTAVEAERGGRQAGIPLGYRQNKDTFTIFGLYSYTGADSEDAFNDLIDAIRETFTQNISLGDPDWVVSTIRNGEISLVDWFGIPCHHCRLMIDVTYHGPAGYT